MGLFDKVIGTGSQELSPAEGFIGVVVGAVAADGVIAQEEMQGLAAVLTRMRLFRGQNPRQVQKMFEKVVKVARDKGADTLVEESAKVLPQELRPTAFAVAADLMFMDGDVASQERKFLERIQAALQVPEDQAVKIVEVMAIKNQG